MNARRFFLLDGSGAPLAVPIILDKTIAEALTAAGARWAEILADSEETINLAFPSTPPTLPAKAETSVSNARRTYKKRTKTKRTMRKRCPECGELFSRKGLGPHMKGKHGKYIHGERAKSGRNRDPLPPGKQRQNCPVCQVEFDVRGLLAHITRTHKAEAQAASKYAAENKEREVRGTATEQFLRDLVAGRRPIPPTSLGQAVAQAAQQKEQRT